MGNVFLQQFLMISDIKTIVFLVALVALFWLIHHMYIVKETDFSIMVLVGTVLGLAVGLAMQAVAGFPENPMETTFIKEVTTWFGLFGNGFINLIKMLVVPLVMVSIMKVVIDMEQGDGMGKLVKNTIAVTMVMVAVAAAVGVLVGMVMGVGTGSTLAAGDSEAKAVTAVATTIKNLIPGNIVQAMVDPTNVIGLVIFSAIFGLAAWWINHEDPEAAKPLYDGINVVHKAMINMALLILDYMPYGVLCLLANTVAQRGLKSIIDVAVFIVALYIAAVIQFIIQLVLLMVHGVSPMPYVKKAAPAMLLAFTSRSSVGCLPMTCETLTKKLGVNNGTASLVAGFGTTAGMQGCAGFFPALLIVYVCNVTGTPMDITMIIMTIIVVAIGSLGIAGIPGTATMAASVALSGVGMGSQFAMISPILAVDPIVDMARTMLNVTGSMTNAIVVDKRCGTFNQEAYNDMSLAKLETKMKK